MLQFGLFEIRQRAVELPAIRRLPLRVFPQGRTPS